MYEYRYYVLVHYPARLPAQASDKGYEIHGPYVGLCAARTQLIQNIVLLISRMREAHGPRTRVKQGMTEQLWYLKPLPKDPPGDEEMVGEAVVYFVGPLKDADEERVIGHYQAFYRDVADDMPTHKKPI